MGGSVKSRHDRAIFLAPNTPYCTEFMYHKLLFNVERKTEFPKARTEQKKLLLSPSFSTLTSLAMGSPLTG